MQKYFLAIEQNVHEFSDCHSECVWNSENNIAKLLTRIVILHIVKRGLENLCFVIESKECKWGNSKGNVFVESYENAIAQIKRIAVYNIKRYTLNEGFFAISV